LKIPQTRKVRKKLGSIVKTSNEDPSFGVRFDDETEGDIIFRYGELALEIMVDRLLHEFNS